MTTARHKLTVTVTASGDGLIACEFLLIPVTRELLRAVTSCYGYATGLETCVHARLSDMHLLFVKRFPPWRLVRALSLSPAASARRQLLPPAHLGSTDAVSRPTRPRSRVRDASLPRLRDPSRRRRSREALPPGGSIARQAVRGDVSS